MRARQLLIKPVSAYCDLQCRYCFYKDVEKHRSRRTTARMSDDVMQAVVEKGLADVDICTFGFQGGEPLLAGLGFFQKFVEEVGRLKKSDQKVLFTVQTNGWSVDERWADFFKKHEFLVGLSLDGVRKSHDSNRLGPCGEGTFEKVFAVACLLRDAGIPLNILCVLNRQTTERIEAIYRFLMRKGFFRQQYIPCLDPLDLSDPSISRDWVDVSESLDEFSLTPSMYENAIKKLFDLWASDRMRGVPVYIRQFENGLQVLRGKTPEACTMYGKCCMQNVIEADGRVYPCDFYALDEYCMGNILETDFDTMLQESMEERAGSFFEDPTRRDDRCPDCRWYPLCRGGCRRECAQDAKGRWKNRYCEANSHFFEYAIERLEWLAARGS